MSGRAPGLLAPFGLAIAAVVASACGLLAEEPVAQPCATPDEGFALVDAADGYELCLPPSWRELAPGDPGWVTIYGEADSIVEEQVQDGTIQHFAVPLEPRADDHALNLAVYARRLGAGSTLGALADQYVRTLEMANIRVTDRRDVVLPLGPATRIEAVRPPSEVSPTTDRAIAYVFNDETRSFHLLYVSMDVTGDRYEPLFDASVRSFNFIDE